MRFAAKRLCETSFYLQRGMKKEPRPEATLAGFDNRLPRAGRPPPMSHQQSCHPQAGLSARFATQAGVKST